MWIRFQNIWTKRVLEWLGVLNYNIGCVRLSLCQVKSEHVVEDFGLRLDKKLNFTEIFQHFLINIVNLSLNFLPNSLMIWNMYGWVTDIWFKFIYYYYLGAWGCCTWWPRPGARCREWGQGPGRRICPAHLSASGGWAPRSSGCRTRTPACPGQRHSSCHCHKSHAVSSSSLTTTSKQVSFPDKAVSSFSFYFSLSIICRPSSFWTWIQQVLISKIEACPFKRQGKSSQYLNLKVLV